MNYVFILSKSSIKAICTTIGQYGINILCINLFYCQYTSTVYLKKAFLYELALFTFLNNSDANTKSFKSSFST